MPVSYTHLNDVREICNLLSEYGILSVVDSVAGLFGESLSFDSSKIDILLGGSQKALSAPPGLTMVWVSDKAWESIENRKTPIASYLSLIHILFISSQSEQLFLQYFCGSYLVLIENMFKLLNFMHQII